MAKRKTSIDMSMFTSGKPVQAEEAEQVPAEGPNKVISISLRESEIDLLEALADQYSVSRHSLMRFGLRWFLAEVAAGRLDLDSYTEEVPTPKRRLKIPK